MPRSGSGIYSKPAGTTAVPNTTITSSQFNTTIDDIAADLNYPRPIVNGGTGATSASSARVSLGLEIGVNIQAYDAGLQSISGLVTSENQMIYTTASDVFAATSLTPFSRTILDDADASTMRETLGANDASNLTDGTLNDDRLSGDYSFGSLTLSGGLTLGTSLAVANGGTGASTAAGARTALAVYSTTEVDTTVSGINTSISAKADNARKIKVGGGLSIDGTSGSSGTPAEGDLSADRLIAIVFATQSDAETGTATDKPVNSAGVRYAINKRATIQKVAKSPSGTVVDFSGGEIPEGAQRIVISFSNIAVGSSTRPKVQIGSSADGILTSGYVGVVSSFGDAATLSVQSATTGIPGDTLNSLGPFSGKVELSRLIDQNSTRWSYSSSIVSHATSPRRSACDGYVVLSGELDRIRFTTEAGATLSGSSASSITISYEF